MIVMDTHIWLIHLHQSRHKERSPSSNPKLATPATIETILANKSPDLT